MNRRLNQLFFMLVLPLAAFSLAGCADANLAGRPGLWPFRKAYDTVPGVTSPAARTAELRKLGRKAAWADAAEKERVSSQLAAAFEVEEDPLIRFEIVRALEACRTPAAASALEQALDDPNPEVRVAACQALGTWGGPQAAGRLGEVLSSDVDMDVRLAAARALGATGDPGAVAALGEALEDRDPAMQYQAVQSLRKVTDQDFGSDVNRWRQFVQGELPPRSKSLSLAEKLRRMF
jgi:HEAT repeat protein